MNLLKMCLIFSAFLCSCSSIKQDNSHNYHEIKLSLIGWDEVFLQNENDYFVYFYSETCVYCKEIKNDVISFYLNKIYTMYFVCTNYKAVYGSPADIYGITDITDFYIFGTPFMVEIRDGAIVNYYAGANDILGLISILNKNNL